MRRAAWVIPALAAAALWLPAARSDVPASAERVCGGGSESVLRKGEWTQVRKPEAIARITAHAATDGGRTLFVTDGETVHRSADGGCSWEEVYRTELPTGKETPAEGTLPRVRRIFVPPAGGPVFLVLDGVGQAAASRVLRSGSGEAGSFSLVEGLPATGGFRQMVAAADNSDVLYLILGYVDAVGDSDPAGASGSLYRSTDGGASWEEAALGAQIEKLAVENDTGAKNVWAVTANGSISYSKDFGTTWLAVTVGPDPEAPEGSAATRWRDVAVHRLATVRNVVVAFGSPTREADVDRVVVSPNGGATWVDIDTNGVGPGRALFGRNDSQLFAASGSQATSFRGPGLLQYEVTADDWNDVDTFGLTSLLDAQRVPAPKPGDPGGVLLVTRRHDPLGDRPDVLAMYEPPPVDPGMSVLGRPDCGDPEVAGLPDRRVRFDGTLDLQLKPGEPLRVPLKALVPAEPVPMDAFFLIDHSESTERVVQGLHCSIERLVKELPKRNLDMRFGLAGYNDMIKWTYRRLVDLGKPQEVAGPIVAELKRLNTLRGAQEPMRSALYQAATGAGLDAMAQNPELIGASQRVPRKVDPGQQANFRTAGDVLRTIIVLADEPYESGTEGEPPVEDVIAALRAKDVHVIGLSVIRSDVRPNDVDHSAPRQLLLTQQLQEFARETGTVAPRGGIDCDGGGSPDVPEGEPVVCRVDERGLKREMDDTLVSVLRSLAGEKIRDVKLVPSRGSELRPEVEGAQVADVDVRRDVELDGAATLACTAEQEGERFKVALDVVVGDDVIDTITGTAQCGVIPAVVPPAKPRKSPAAPEPAPEPLPQVVQPAPQAPAPVNPPNPQPAAVAAPPPGPPAPAPVSSVPAQAPASAQAPMPQAGVMAQEREQVAVKAATVKVDGAGPADYAMVARRVERPSPVPLEAALTLGGGLCGLAGYVALGLSRRSRRRDAIRPARVEVRER